MCSWQQAHDEDNAMTCMTDSDPISSSTLARQAASGMPEHSFPMLWPSTDRRIIHVCRTMHSQRRLNGFILGDTAGKRKRNKGFLSEANSPTCLYGENIQVVLKMPRVRVPRILSTQRQCVSRPIGEDVEKAYITTFQRSSGQADMTRLTFPRDRRWFL